MNRLEAICVEKENTLEQMTQLSQDRLSELRSLENDLQRNRDHSAQVQTQIQLDSERLTKLVQSIGTKTTRAEELEYHLEVLVRETAKLCSRRKAIEDSIARLMQTENDLNQKIDSITMQFESTSLETQRQISESQKALDNSQLLIHDAEKELSGTKHEIEKAVGELDEKKSSVQVLESSIATANARLHELQLEHSQLGAVVADLRKRCSELEKAKTIVSEAVAELALEKEQIESKTLLLKSMLDEQESRTIRAESNSMSHLESSPFANLDENTNISFDSAEITMEENILSEMIELQNFGSSTQDSTVSTPDAWDAIFAGSTVSSQRS